MNVGKAQEDLQKNVWFIVKIERPRKDALKKVLHEDHITLSMEGLQEGGNHWIVMKIERLRKTPRRKE